MQQALNMHYCNTEDLTEAIKLEFARANNVIEMATNSLAKRHALNAAKCEKFLDNLPEDEPPTLEDFTTAMGNLRQHNNVYTVIPIDEEGSARFFEQSETETPVRPKQKCSCLPPSCAPGRATPQQTKPSRIHDAWKQYPSPKKKNTKKDDNDDDEDVIPVTVRWECHEDLFKKAITSLQERGKADKSMFDPQHRILIDEESLKQAYGKNLEKVAAIRDEYPSVACDCCEMLKMGKDLKTLRSYANRKGFDDMLTSVLEKFQQDLRKT
ncbi:hypothetical protein QYM36_000360 [Artemia franciscana]|uniref:Uncharacterized protein n=1 Tax=Artemia franciscana TaxID=6661 RepID=A0AA88LJA6_ARTSF|nr:hypothetical protein QYM36_000360 [Artemia franciscana]